MTRYIEVDELVNELHEHFSNGFDEDEWWNSTHVLTAIEETPTVDAVPVSFIFDKMSTINAEYINIQRLIDTEPETGERRIGIGIATNLLREYNTLRNLIREWEEGEKE